MKDRWKKNWKLKSLLGAMLLVFGLIQSNTAHTQDFRVELGEDGWVIRIGDDQHRDPIIADPYHKVVTCESNGDRYQACDVGYGVRGARILRQLSWDSCVYSRTWGFDDRGVWVAGGCRAVFEVELDDYFPAPRSFPMTCESKGSKTRKCNTGTYIYDAYVERRFSRASCERGKQWWIDGKYLVVKGGCRARFMIIPERH